MAIVKTEDIIAYEVGEQLVCPKCATKQEIDGAQKKDLMLEPDRDDESLIFCDRCEEQI